MKKTKIKKTTIWISADTTWRELNKLKRAGDTMDDVVQRLLKGSSGVAGMGFFVPQISESPKSTKLNTISKEVELSDLEEPEIFHPEGRSEAERNVDHQYRVREEKERREKSGG